MNDRTQNIGDQDRPAFDHCRHYSPVDGAVAAQAFAGPGEGSFENRRTSVFERMSQWNLRLNPFQTVPGKRKRFECRGTRGKRMNGGTDVVKESGKRDFGRARSAANDRSGLEDCRWKSGLRQHDCCGQAIRPGADYECLINASTPRAIPASPTFREMAQFARTQAGNRPRRTSASTTARFRRARAET